MTPDQTSKILESLNEFVQNQTDELESQNELLLEKAKKEFEELVKKPDIQQLILARDEQRSFANRKRELKDAVFHVWGIVVGLSKRIVGLVRQVYSFLSRQFRRKFRKKR